MSTLKVTLPNGTVVEGLTFEQFQTLNGIPLNAKNAGKPAKKQAIQRHKKRAKVVRTAVQETPKVVNDVNSVKSAVSLLVAIRDGGRHGINADTVQAVLGVTHPKAISSKSSGINRLLDDMPYRRNSVYTNDRTVNGRIWKPGKNLQHALDELLKLQTAH